MSIYYGGDYNPEQWPREVWGEDVSLMQRAGVNLATVAVFSWAKLEPRQGEYDFSWLDDVIDGLHAGNVRVDLATATASPPPWLAAAYPESLPVTEDGTRLAVGSRQQYCPSSPAYRRHAKALVERMVERYATHPAVEMWHVNNEYGCHVTHCYCEVSNAAFRVWLQNKYGDIDGLNAAWGTAFWSQQYASFAEVSTPSAAPTFKNPTQMLDFDRFSSDELIACYDAEVEVIRASSDLPITTNFMGFFKPANYWKWAKKVDVVSDDAYPDPADPISTPYVSMTRDLMRSLGGGKPWILMEQATSAVNWRKRNAPKAPGQMRALSYQAVSRGADGILFFQWRQSAAGAEKFHSGMLPHSGTDTRIWREVEQLGNELKQLSAQETGLEGATLNARVAMVFDWDSWWASEQAASPAQVSYVEVMLSWYQALRSVWGVVDFAEATGDLSGYDLVVVPSHMVTSHDQGRSLAQYAKDGGTLVVGFGTALTDENLRIHLGGYLGEDLRDALGLWIEELMPLAGPDQRATGTAPAPNIGIAGDVLGGATEGRMWSEALRVTDAEVRATFTTGALAGQPAITSRSAGEGSAWYVATLPEDPALHELVRSIAADRKLQVPAAVSSDDRVEVVTRGGVTFVINHGNEKVAVELAGENLLTGEAVSRFELAPFDVAVLRTSQE